MAIAPGTRLGVYEVTAQIGVGGMGEVYRATDTTLARQVAIKILPDAFATDPERLARFEREAKTLAVLNHPNIAAIYGLEYQERLRPRRAEEKEIRGERVGPFLVMELVEGPTLADLIAGHPSPEAESLRSRPRDDEAAARRGGGAPRGLAIEDGLPIAKQIADALEAAHEQNIIHRDLKPANIKVRADGMVKVLDFGLAKAMEPTGAAAVSASMSPTMSLHGTLAGMILGTAAYMAPEQASAKPVDKRADVWSFGVVLWEMLTGQRLFEGETISHTLADVLRGPIDFNRLPADTPRAIRELLRRCLNRDVKKRLRDMGEARIAIEESLSGAARDEIASAAPPAAASVVIVPASRWRERIAWAAAALGLSVAGIAATMYVQRADPAPVQVRFEVTTPGRMNDPLSFALSPDGRRLAFVTSTNGVPRLWVRPLDQVTPQVLAGTEGASYPFWSPDSRAIGFFADGKLKRIDLSGGAPRVLADAPAGRGGTWNQDDVIVFASTSPVELKRVAATGGTPASVTRVAGPGQTHRWPQFLPDGRRFLFVSQLGAIDARGVFIGSLDGGEPLRVAGLDPGTSPLLVAGALLQVRDGTLVSQPFDMSRGALMGEPVAIAQSVGWDSTLYRGAFTASATGVLAHRPGGVEQRQLVWFDRAGVVKGRIGTPDESALSTPEMSPDGKRVAVFRSVAGNIDVWLVDTVRGVVDRFTSDQGIDSSPVWSPDGRRIVFRSNRTGVYDLFEKPVSEDGDERPLFVTPESKAPVAWSRDGRFLLYGSASGRSRTDLWAWPLTGALRQAQGGPSADSKPFPVAQSAFEEAAGQFSPDGQWVAYQSDESGRTEIYARPFPGPGRQRLISTAGGSQPRWRPDGKELFYIAPDGTLMAAALSLQADRQALEAGAPVPLFVTHLARGANVFTGGPGVQAQYVVAPDGRFLMNVAIDEGTTSPPITVVLNWNVGMKP